MISFVAWFEALPTALAALSVVGGFVVISIACALLVRRAVAEHILHEHNELTGFIFAVVGVIYAVLLAFVTIGVWERFAEADARAFHEAASVTALYRDAAALENGAPIRRDLREYTQSIVDRSWPAMAAGRESRESDDLAERLAMGVNRYVPVNAGERDVHAAMEREMSAAMSDREARLSASATGLNGIMWAVVIIGGWVTVGFACLFGFRNVGMQAVITGTLAFLVGLVIFLTMSLDFPYRGSVHVSPEAFQQALREFAVIDAHPNG